MKLPEPPPSGSFENMGLTKLDPADQQRLLSILSLVPTGAGRDRARDYLHWEKLKYKPLPAELETHEDWWLLLKLRRRSAFRPLPLQAINGKNFMYWLPDVVQKKLHQVDQHASGRIEIAEAITNPQARDRYLVSSLIEEAITSSQLEGASTSHRVAKKLLRDGRAPLDSSERMIVNNYRAMQFIRDEVGTPLSPELLFELHRVVTEGTLNNADEAGRLRRPAEDIAVYDRRDHTLLHTPPAAEELPARIDALCRFANTEPDDDEGFMHPVVRAILLHFMIGFDHPFVDGNGRTARALFYWAMARQGYWLMEYISISTVLRKASTQYMRAYLYTEHDDNDATYFIDFHLSVILTAIQRLQKYLANKVQEVKRVETLLGDSVFTRSLNHRQIALLSHAIRQPQQIYTIESHRHSHKVSYPTARADLLKLEELKLLEMSKVRNAFVFKSVVDIEQRLVRLRQGR